MGRKALKLSAVPPKFPALFAGHFALTNISLPCNAGIAVRTTKRDTFFTVTAREGTSTDFGRVQLSAALLHISGGFRQPTFLCHSLLFVKVIIFENKDVSRGGFISQRLIQAQAEKDKTKRSGNQIQKPVRAPLEIQG